MLNSNKSEQGFCVCATKQHNSLDHLKGDHIIKTSVLIKNNTAGPARNAKCLGFSSFPST